MFHVKSFSCSISEAAVVCLFTYQGMETRAKVVGCDENVVGTSAPVPKWVLLRDEFHGGSNKSACVTYRRETINGAKVTRNVYRYEEEVSIVRVKRTNVACQKSLMNDNLGRKQMGVAPLIRKPIGVVF